MNPIFKKIKDKIEEIIKKYNLNERDAKELFTFMECYQMAAEASPGQYSNFNDFFNKRIKNNPVLAESDKKDLAGTEEALEIMQHFYQEENT